MHDAPHVGVRMAAAHCAFMAAVAIAASIANGQGIDFGFLSRDPNYLAAAPFYAGALSNLGVLLWWSAGTAALLACALLWDRAANGRTAILLGTAGALSCVLALDDLYMVHEIVAPRYFGVAQPVVMAVYALAAGAWAVSFRALLIRRHPAFLAFAALLIAGSVAVDVVRDHLPLLNVVIEDGLKLAGVAAWCGWLWRVAFVEVTHALPLGEPLADIPRKRAVESWL